MIYSERIFGGALGLADTALYTVPAGGTVVLRDVEAYNYSAAVASLSLSVLVSGINNHCLQLPLPAPIQSTQWQGRIVLMAGDVLQGHVTTVQNFIYISGYVFAS